jgi:hypothetical protein
MPESASDLSGRSLTIEVSLRNVRPAIWRRLTVPTDLSLLSFHDVLQKAYGWTDSHMHAFVQGRRRFEVFHPGYEQPRGPGRATDERDVVLGELLRAKGDALAYQYDMGDFWEHSIVVEEVSEGADGKCRCLAGARSGPPEDCGGAARYLEILEALANPDHPEHEELSECLGDGFDPEAFSLAAINRSLAKLKRRK